MKNYPAYKDSGVEWLGEIPEEWEKKRLKYVAEINPSRKSDISGDQQCVFIPMEAMRSDGSFDNSNTKPYSELKTGFTYFTEKDVIFAKITPCFENGKGALLKNLGSEIGFGSTEFHVLRAILHRTIPEFLYYLTISGIFRRVGEAFMQGVAGQKRVTNSFVENYVIGLPSLEEQTSIASFLDHKTAQIDGLIAKKERMIELLKDERAAVINQAVTKGLNPKAEMKDSGIEWSPRIPLSWHARPVKAYFDVQLGKMLQNDSQSPADKQVPYLKALHVNWGNVQRDDLPTMWASPNDILQYEVADGDLLVCEGGEVGRSGIVKNPPKDCVIQNALHRVRVKNGSHIGYLLYVLNAVASADWFSILCNKATIAHFTREKFVHLRIPIPSIDEQKAIVEFLDRKTAQLDDQVTRAQQAIELLKEYRTALISEVVTGKIDVREAGRDRK